MKQLFISLSAIPLSMVKKYVRSNLNHYSNIFNKYGTGKGKEKYRIYIPLDDNKPVVQTDAPKVVVDELQQQGYEVENYIAGIARKSGTNRSIRIGRILKSEEAKKAFETDPRRKAGKVANNELIAVISRHPYDIVGMSFDRGWTSCMDLKSGGNQRYLKDDVKHGTLVAYLIRNNDKNINAPIARVLLKPYLNGGGKRRGTILVADGYYGTSTPGFKKVVDKFCEWANSGSPAGLYELTQHLYADATNTIYIHGTIKPSDVPREQWENVVKLSADFNTLKLFIDRGIFATLCENDKAPKEIFEYALPFFKKAEIDDQISFVQSRAPEAIKMELVRKNPKVLVSEYFGTQHLAETAEFLIDHNHVVVRDMSREVLLHSINRAIQNNSSSQFLSLMADIDSSRKFCLDNFKPFKLDEVPGLEKFLKKAKLQDECLNYFMFDKDCYDMFYRISTETEAHKSWLVLNHSALNREILIPHVKRMKLKDCLSVVMHPEVFFAIYEVYGMSKSLAEKAVNYAHKMNLEMLKLCLDFLDKEEILSIVDYGSSELVTYIAENLNTKLFRAITVATHRKEFLQELRNRPVADRRFIAKNKIWRIAQILHDDPDPEVQRLIKMNK